MIHPILLNCHDAQQTTHTIVQIGNVCGIRRRVDFISFVIAPKMSRSDDFYGSLHFSIFPISLELEDGSPFRSMNTSLAAKSPFRATGNPA